jgi:hypothetical protein
MFFKLKDESSMLHVNMPLASRSTEPLSLSLELGLIFITLDVMITTGAEGL